MNLEPGKRYLLKRKYYNEYDNHFTEIFVLEVFKEAIKIKYSGGIEYWVNISYFERDFEFYGELPCLEH